MVWFIYVSVEILRGMLKSADSQLEYKKEIDRLIDDVRIVREETGEGFVLVNLFGAYKKCSLHLGPLYGDAFVNRTNDFYNQNYLNIAKYQDGVLEMINYPVFKDIYEKEVTRK